MKLISDKALSDAIKDSRLIMACEKKHGKHRRGKFVRRGSMDGYGDWNFYRCRWCPILLVEKANPEENEDVSRN